jgi:competence protein ComEC
MTTERRGWTGPILAFALGVGAFHLLPEPLPWAALLAVAVLLALIVWARWWGHWRGHWQDQTGSAQALGFAHCILGGLAWAQFHACLTLCHPFPEHYTRADLVIEGQVASLPADSGSATRFLFRVESARHGESDVGFTGLARLSWYRDAPALSVGERWRLAVRLKPPHGLANPGGFDYERWLFEQGVTATGSVRPGDRNTCLDPGPGRYWLGRLRERLRDHIADRLAGSPATGLVQALSLGERSAIPPDQWEVLTRTGTNHLVAISGLHVGLVAAFAFFVARWFWTSIPRLALALAAPRAATIAAFATALGYSALAGFSISTQRSLIMLAVLLGAVYWGRTARPFAALTLALGLVLVLDPQTVLSFGFWLSFGAVAALLYALGSRPLVWAGGRGAGDETGPRDAWPKAGSQAWTRWVAPQWAVGLGLLPALLLLFGRASLISPAVNLVAVPLFAVLLPALLLALLLSLIPGLGLPLAWMGQVLTWCLNGLDALAGLPWAAVTVAERPAWVWAAAFGGVVLLLAPRGLPGRHLGLVALLPLALVRLPVPAAGDAWFTLLDVGQGLAAVVRTQRHTLVYDTGPGFASGFETGSAVVLPFLQQAGVGRIDTLVLSHADKDHIGGLTGLRRGLPIGTVLSGEPAAFPEGQARPCRAGEGWDWDGVHFDILHPGPRATAGDAEASPPGAGGSGQRPEHNEAQGNDSSCVLRVGAGGAAVLLTGDIGRGAEAMLVRDLGPALHAEVLVAAHHGSASSSSSAFLAAVAPRYVLYATGFADRFGFPSPRVRERVGRLGSLELDTGVLGAISFRLTAGSGLLGPSWYRARHARLWTHRPPPEAVPVQRSSGFGYD